MSDAARLDFLAELMNLSVIVELGGPLSAEKRAWLGERSTAIFLRYEFHRRSNDTPTAFRMAVDDVRSVAPEAEPMIPVSALDIIGHRRGDEHKGRAWWAGGTWLEPDEVVAVLKDPREQA
jgi:hypothetical protein